MKKIKLKSVIIIIFLSIVISVSLSAQSANKNDFKIIKDRIFSLEKQVNSFQKIISTMKVQIDGELKTANRILSYSGWVGILITLFILVFAAIQVYQFIHMKNELNESMKKFNDFIDKPEKINDAIEDMTITMIEKELRNTVNRDEIISTLNRANILTEKSRKKIANNIQHLVFNQKYNELIVTKIALYVSLYIDDPSNYALSILVTKGFDSKNNTYELLSVLFKNKPYVINPFEFVQENEHYRKNIELVKNLLSGESQKEFIFDCLKKYKDYPEWFSLLGKVENRKAVSEKELTHFVSENLLLLDDYEFYYKIYYSLEYNENVARHCLKNERIRKQGNTDSYFSRSIRSKENFTNLLNLIDVNNLTHWEMLVDDIKKYAELEKWDILKDLLSKNGVDITDNDKILNMIERKQKLIKK